MCVCCSYRCDCEDTGFVGDHCQEDIPECASDPCQHGGTCVDGISRYSCQCWPGEWSLHPIHPSQQGRSSSRLLSAGYRGDHCQVDVDECEQNPCENGGSCFQRSDVLVYGTLAQLSGTSFSYHAAAGFICSCSPGFTGRTIKAALRSVEGWEEDSDEALLSQETTAPSTWTSAPPPLVNTEEAARMASTLISVCVQVDSQVGKLHHQVSSSSPSSSSCICLFSV